VALQARNGRVKAGERPAGCAVIKRTVRPEHGVMAVLTSGREAGLNVIHRRLGIVVIRLVAGNAGRARQVVVVVDMTLDAWRRSVEARQCPARRRVIELAVGPENRIVTVLARRRIIQPNVVNRSLCVVVIRLMARRARGVRKVVVIIDVA